VKRAECSEVSAVNGSEVCAVEWSVCSEVK